MTAAPILETLRRHGVTVRREGDRLKLKPATGNVPADVVELARAHKAELLAALPDTPPRAELRARLADAAEREGVARRLIEALPDAELEGVEYLGELGLAAAARAIEADHDRMQGKAPRGWTYPGHCRRCGPVWLSHPEPETVLGCPWCRIRRMGLALPRPCTHPTTDHARN